jgi:hypothetical protein
MSDNSTRKQGSRKAAEHAPNFERTFPCHLTHPARGEKWTNDPSEVSALTGKQLAA